MDDQQTPREMREDLLEAIRVNESLLHEQQAHVSMHAARLEALEWQAESIRQRVSRQHEYFKQAPERMRVIQATLETQRVQLSELDNQVVVAKTKIGMKQLCELLGRLMADPNTINQGRELLKGINTGLGHTELWAKFSGGKA